MEVNPDRVVSITFELSAAVGAVGAFVVGDFNNWSQSAHPMIRDDTGGFALTVELVSGRFYRYRYWVDGERWENDWNADSYIPNPYGGEDSVVDLAEGSERMVALAASDPSSVGKGSGSTGPR